MRPRSDSVGNGGLPTIGRSGTHLKNMSVGKHDEAPPIGDPINLRNDGDIYSLQNLMGHADLQVLRRYLAQTNENLLIAHKQFSPVDNAEL